MALSFAQVSGHLCQVIPIFKVRDQRGGTHLDTGVIFSGDRAAAERAATYAIELLKQQKREWSPELPAGAPRTTQL